jgi:hypothetical protein
VKLLPKGNPDSLSADKTGGSMPSANVTSEQIFFSMSLPKSDIID